MVDSLLDKYDIYYTNNAAAKLGFMLARSSSGPKAWMRADSSPLPDNYPSSDISYANLSPDVQKVISQRFLHGGLGALEFEIEDDASYQILRYLKSQNIDCRCRGKAYPGPKIISVTVPQYPAITIVNANCELTTGWTGGARSAAQKYSGTYSWLVSAGASAYQTLDSSVSFRGTKVTFKMWAMAGNVSTARIGIHDGVTPSYSSYHTGGGGWEQLSVTKTMGVAATELTLYLMRDTAIDVYYDDAEILVPINGAPIRGVDFNSLQYIAFGNVLAKLNGAGTAYTYVDTLPATITSLAVMAVSGADYLFIGQGKANFYYYMVAAETFTLSNLADGKADKFCTVGTSLWRLYLPNNLRVATNPLNGGSWGAAVTCGEAAYNVNDMWDYGGILWCLKEDGAYYYNSTDTAFYSAFPELTTITNEDAGKNSTVFRGGLYFRMGNQQEWEIKGGVLTEITPSLFSQGIADYAYPCVARAHDESWLYAIIKRGSADLAVMAGRWEYIAGRTRWIWHEIRSINLTDVSTAFVSSVEGRPYLYLGSTVSTENVYKVYLPVTNDATADADYRFYTAGSLWTPRYASLLYATDKRWQQLYVNSESLTATNYITANYSIDDGATFTALADIDTSPEQTKSFTNIESTMMNLKLDFVGDSETVPPVLNYHNLKCLILMDAIAKFTHTIKCDKGLRLKNNIMPPTAYTYSAIRAFIDTLRDTVCTLGDVSGIEHTVRVRVLKEEEVFDQDEKRPMLHYTLESMKVL